MTLWSVFFRFFLSGTSLHPIFKRMSKKSPRTPRKTRIYAIGDIHGRADLLDRVLTKIDTDAQKTPIAHKILVMLGDYIDRGPESARVLARLGDLRAERILDGFKIHLLKGNHEERMLDFLVGHNERESAAWLANGGANTLASYGLNLKHDQSTLRRELNSTLPRSHKFILRSLQYCVIEGDYGFVHAGVRPGIPWQDQNPADLLWIRDKFLNSNADFGPMIVHGHAAGRAPDIRTNRINIDTRAWSSDILTCLVLEGTKRRFLST